jgi:predicted nucleotidyltransferase
MRLQPDQQQAIVDAVRAVTPTGTLCDLRLFGSRLNDRARGGDVDLYLEVTGLDSTQSAELRRRLRVRLKEALDLPVDLVLQQREKPFKLVSQIAREEGVSLVEGTGEGKLAMSTTQAPAETEALKAHIEKIVSGYPEIRVVLLFGSAAQNRLTSDSDIDIAVAADQPLGPEMQADLHLDLAGALPWDVDLIDLQEVSGIILQQALCHGVLIRSTPGTYASLIQRMWYNQADMMPYTRRVLERHAQRFIHG